MPSASGRASASGRGASNRGSRVTPATRSYGVLLADNNYRAVDYAAGIRVREKELNWGSWNTADGTFNAAYPTTILTNYAAERTAGFSISLDMGLQYPPAWATAIRPFVDQYGNTYSTKANVIWSAGVREAVAAYIEQVFTTFGTDFHSVRCGAGTFIETMYPNNASGFSRCYWAFDDEAQADCPVAGWIPGDAVTDNQAEIFYLWYVDRLAETANFLHTEIRKYYSGTILQLFAGKGVAGSGYASVISAALTPAGGVLGTAACERGVMIDRIVDGITDRANLALCTGSLNDSSADSANEASANEADWSSAHWLAWNADRIGVPKWGENVGSDGPDRMTLAFSKADEFGYDGLMWAWDYQLNDTATYPDLAHLADYAAAIAAATP